MAAKAADGHRLFGQDYADRRGSSCQGGRRWCGIIRRSASCVLCRGRHKTHWTGHPTRCARNLKGRFGEEAYAAEELIAELGAAFLCADLALASEPRPDHAAYVQTWLKVLRGDKRAIFTAAAKAQAAADFAHAQARHLHRASAPSPDRQAA